MGHSTRTGLLAGRSAAWLRAVSLDLCLKPCVQSISVTMSVAIARLWEQKKIDLDERVAAYIPAFGANGKRGVKVHQLLTHTAGFPYALRTCRRRNQPLNRVSLSATLIGDWPACLQVRGHVDVEAASRVGRGARDLRRLAAD